MIFLTVFVQIYTYISYILEYIFILNDTLKSPFHLSNIISNQSSTIVLTYSTNVVLTHTSEAWKSYCTIPSNVFPCNIIEYLNSFTKKLVQRNWQQMSIDPKIAVTANQTIFCTELWPSSGLVRQEIGRQIFTYTSHTYTWCSYVNIWNRIGHNQMDTW